MGSQLELFPCGKLGFNERCGKLSSTPLRRSAASRGERIRLRNRVMTARLYYWREIMRRRLDDVMIILAENEFFVDERTINNAWLECADFFEWLCQHPCHCPPAPPYVSQLEMVTLYIVYKIGYIYNFIDFEPVRPLLWPAPRSSE